MKTFFKCTLAVFLFVVGFSATIIALFFLIPTNSEITINNSENTSDFTRYYDTHNQEIECYSQSSDHQLEDFQPYTKKAFIASEDKRFFDHNGVDVMRMMKAAVINIKDGKFSQGASTITQQLVKNTSLSSSKTIERKLKEIKLAQKLESNYTKDEILKAYLNTIYFGENCYGIESAANYYFGKSEKDLDLSEITLLCASIKSPSKINPVKNLELTRKKQALVLNAMVNCGYITDEEKRDALNARPLIVKKRETGDNSFISAVRAELNELKLQGLVASSVKVYTDYDEGLQSFIEESVNSLDYDKQVAVLSNDTAAVKAYYSTCSLIERNPASTIKPISIYAQAIEDGVINQYTIINDEPVLIDGFAVENYKNKYMGNVTVRDALKLSLNSPSAKILNTVGINKCKNALNKMDFQIENASMDLSVGYLENGVDLITLSGAYATLANGGVYTKPHFITRILDEKGNTVYTANNDKARVFSTSTASVMTDILMECAKSGTAKKLSDLQFDIACKTGTFGNESGNTDAYSISYTNDTTFAVWLGYDDSTLMPNYVTGGGLPTSIVKEVVAEYYKNEKPAKFALNGTKKVKIDKIALENTGKVLLASDNTPEKYVLTAIFKESDDINEISDVFTRPKITDEMIFVEDNKVKISYNKYDFYSVKVYKTDESGKKLVYEGNETNLSFDQTLTTCEYSIIAVCRGKNEIVYGQEIFLPKINGNANNYALPRDWWYE